MALACPSGTINVLSTVYGSVDGTTCLPVSVTPTLQKMANGQTTYSVYVFNGIVPFTSYDSNKLSVTYQCLSTTATSTFTAVAGASSSLSAICSMGSIVISFTGTNFMFGNGSSCSAKTLTSYLQSKIPAKTTELSVFTNFPALKDDCIPTTGIYQYQYFVATYPCSTATAPQYTAVAWDYSYMFMKCPVNTKAHVVNSTYYSTFLPLIQVAATSRILPEPFLHTVGSKSVSFQLQ